MTFKRLAFIFLAFQLSACKTPRAQREVSADPDQVMNVVRHLPPTEGSKIMTVTSWNVKHLGRNLFDPRQASPLLAGADIVAFQEVNTSASGLQALQGIAQHLAELIKERVCVALSEIPTDGKERYAYIWRNTRVAYVKTNGEILENCPDQAITIRLGAKNAQDIQREPAFGVFYFRPSSKQFVLSTIHLLPTAKKPENEVKPLFEGFQSVSQPLIVAGDYNLDSDHHSFQAARTLGFIAAMVNVKTSLKMKSREMSKPYDNFWFRGIKLVEHPKVINLYDVFTEKSHREIYKNFSDHCPIVGKFEFL